MSGWKSFRIGDLVEPVKSWNPLRSDPDDTFKYIDLSAVDQSLKRIVAAREIPCAEAPSRAKQLVKTNDVLVSTVRPNLNGVAQVGQELDGSTASTGFCVLRPRAKLLSSSYLFHWVKTEQFIADMVRKATGASYPAVSDKTILESTIAAPAIAEQCRIAAILDQADALRAKRREALVMTEALIQSVFNDALKESGDNVLRMSVEDCMSAIIDYRGKTPTKTDSGVPLITARVVKGGELLEPNEFIAEGDYDSWMRRGMPQSGDVLFTTEAPLGEVAQLDSRRVALAQRLLLLRGKSGLLDNTFLKFALTSPEVKSQIGSRSSGSTVKGIRQKELRQVLIPIPPMKLSLSEILCVRHTIPPKEFHAPQDQQARYQRQIGTSANFSQAT